MALRKQLHELNIFNIILKVPVLLKMDPVTCVFLGNSNDLSLALNKQNVGLAEAYKAVKLTGFFGSLCLSKKRNSISYEVLIDVVVEIF